MKTPRPIKTSKKKNSQKSFEKRKQDHIKLALSEKTQTENMSMLELVHLQGDGIPAFDFNEISLQSVTLGHQFSSPIFVSSMTAGHSQSTEINRFWAWLSEEKNILCSMGSQRRELEDGSAKAEWKKIRKLHPKAKIMGNLGITQLISSGVDKALELIDNIEAIGFFVHFNALQEVLQPEGTPQFRGALSVLEKLIQKSPVPIVAKEVGCGFSRKNISDLAAIGIYAVDVAGLGGTHWGRVEGLRSTPDSMLRQVAGTFENWGYSTVESLLDLQNIHVNCQIWASGGVRTGLDAAKMCAMGASMIGIAQPWMKTYIEAGINQRERAVLDLYEKYIYELKVALFCTGSINFQKLKGKFQVSGSLRTEK